MSQDLRSDFGRYLKACRAATGRSLGEIAKQTKITRTCLQYIENEDLNHLPHAVFVKGFLKAYAEAVGGDADDVLRRYQNRCGAQIDHSYIESRKSHNKNFWRRFLLAWIVMAALIGVTLYAAHMHA